MVSIRPTFKTYDFQQMWDFPSRDCKNTLTKNSLMYIIKTHPDLKYFSKIVEKTNYKNKLNQLPANFTLFAVPDYFLLKHFSKKQINNIDISLAYKILNYSLMNRKLDKSILQSSPVSIFPTLDRSNSMRITTYKGITSLPNNINVVKWNLNAFNGIIHLIDNLLIPTQT